MACSAAAFPSNTYLLLLRFLMQINADSASEL